MNVLISMNLMNPALGPLSLTAQAVVPYWIVSLAVYLLVAIPAALAISIVAIILSFGRVGARPFVRRLAGGVFVQALANAGLVNRFYVWTEPGEVLLQPWHWLLLVTAMISAAVFGGLAFWRSFPHQGGCYG